MKSGRLIAMVVMIVVLVILGGLREIIFVNINEQLLFNAGQIQDYRVLDSFSFLSDLTVSQLNRLKWVLTVVLSLMYMILGFATFKWIIRDLEGAKWTLLVYVALFILAGMSFLVGHYCGRPETGYTLARVFMGALQSPFILMIMIPARMLAKRS